MTTDAGGLLLREIAEARGLMDRMAACSEDHRDRSRVEHAVRELVAQRIYAIAPAYEDLNDHEQSRRHRLRPCWRPSGIRQAPVGHGIPSAARS